MSAVIPYEIPPQAVKSLIDSGKTPVLIDVREPQEHALCHIEGAHLIPMGNIPARLQQLEAAADSAPLIIFCHHGMRSLSVVNWLRQQGVPAQSMSGGIDQWSLEIDAAVPRY